MDLLNDMNGRNNTLRIRAWNEGNTNYTPSDGDLIKDQRNHSVYNAQSGRWEGSLTVLQPGQGYLYLNNSSETKILIYPNSTP